MLAPDTQSYRVLIVEDEPLIAMMIADMLVDLGHSVGASARDHTEAMAALEGAKFDVALLDVNLGPDTSLEVAENCDGRNVPVVFTTGYSVRDLPAQCDGRPVLTKPFAIEDLRRALERLSAPDGGLASVTKPLSN